MLKLFQISLKNKTKLKVLFIARGKNNNKPGYVVQNQADSLRSEGIDVDFFLVKTGGLIGYIKAYFLLKKSLLAQYDVIHAHYSFCGLIATLKTSNLVVSLMGSDILNCKAINLAIIRFCANNFWRVTILKSPQMAEKLNCRKDIHLVPNGVNLNLFKPMNFNSARNKLNLSNDISYILFVGDPTRDEKNFELVREVVKLINENKVKLLIANNIDPSEMPLYYNSSNCLLVTSFYEGSMNAIKEAMACNLPILSTDVGDSKFNIGEMEYCEIIPFDPYVIAKKVEDLCLEIYRNSARDRILKLHLDQRSVNYKLRTIYKNVCKGSNNN
jgi:teichuronic acid biosynthesis glycosyltransferase TuaC